MRILVYHIGSLGDTLVAVPALWVVRENFPDAQITMLTDEQPGRGLVQSREILDGSGLVEDFITYPAGRVLAKLRLLAELRARRFDTLVYLVRTWEGDRRLRRDVLFFRLAGIQRQLGTQRSCDLATHGPHGPLPIVPHAADAHIARLRAAGLKTPPAGQGRTSVGIGQREYENVKRWLAELPDDGGRRWFGLGPGSKMPCKVWPLERYGEVAKGLVAENDAWPVVFGGPGDRELGQRLVGQLGRGYVAAGALGVRDSMAAMQRCALFLGNDTGTMHMAAASGVRCVVPFTSREAPGRWYPYGAGHVVLRTPVPCEGCMLEVCVEQQMQCILSISAEQVLNACRAIFVSAERR